MWRGNSRCVNATTYVGSWPVTFSDVGSTPTASTTISGIQFSPRSNPKRPILPKTMGSVRGSSFSTWKTLHRFPRWQSCGFSPLTPMLNSIPRWILTISKRPRPALKGRSRTTLGRRTRRRLELREYEGGVRNTACNGRRLLFYLSVLGKKARMWRGDSHYEKRDCVCRLLTSHFSDMGSTNTCCHH